MEEIEKSVAIITESLTKLQNLVEPMHNQTHKQNRLETNISSLLSKLEQLLSALNDPTSLEAALSQLQFLAPFNIVVAVSAKARLALYAQNKLKLLLTDYDNYLKTIDPELKNLSNLFNESYKILSQCGHTVDPLPHVTNFVSTRSTLLITSLPQNTTFSVYATSFFKTLKTERDLVSKLFPKQVATQTFINTIIPIVDVWLEYCNTTITRCKAKFSVDGEVMDVDSFECIIEMVEILSTLSKEYEGLLAYCATKGTDINNIQSTLKKLAINFLKIFIDEIKSDPKGIPSQTGTVAEISSKTLNISRRLLDHQVILETLLNEGWGVMNSLPIQNFSGLNVEIFDYLVLNLENRVKIYAKNKQVLGTVFLMNNFNYIGKILGREQKLEAMFNGMEKMNTLLSKQKSIYLNSWKPVYDHLFDSTYISAGAMSKVLTKAQRDVVKDNFKGFNQEFEDIIKTQSVWEVPDVELKATIIKDLKATLSLLYSRFHDRYKSNTGLEFSKTPEKYIKYSVEGVDSALDTLFKS